MHRGLSKFLGSLGGSALRCACVLVACLGAAGSSQAEPEGPGINRLRLSGFGTVGLSRTSAPPNWGFQRETSQPGNDGGTRVDTDSRLGVQANYALDPRFELIGQLLLTPRMSAAVPGDTVSWAVAAYRPTDSLTLRAGRISADLYLLSDYRSVGLAFPFVRPPVEFYGILPSSFDGLDATQSWRDGADATWKLNGFYGRTKQGDNRTSTFRTFSPTYGLVFSREEQGLLVKGSIARTTVAKAAPVLAPLIAALQPVTLVPVSEVAANAARLQQQLTLQGQTIDYFGVGLNFDRDGWLLMLELSRARVHSVKQIESGYALLGHRFGGFTPYVVLSAARGSAEGDPPQWQGPLTPVVGPTSAAQTQALGDLAYNSAMVRTMQRSVSLGTRWDVTQQAALTFQYDRIRVGERGSLLWSHGGDEPASAHVLTATLDFIF